MTDRSHESSDVQVQQSLLKAKAQQREFKSMARREPEREKRRRLRDEIEREFGIVQPELARKYKHGYQ